jgi:hypothetical protein
MPKFSQVVSSNQADPIGREVYGVGLLTPWLLE